MKAREWQRFLEEQYRMHGKCVFTITELGNAAGTSRAIVNVELGRLRQYGIVVKYGYGRYGLPRVVTPEILLSSLDSFAYITGAYALYHHHLIAQVPARITCFTRRRHGLARARVTPVGMYEFICVRGAVYKPPDDSLFAPPEQALCDYVYLVRRRGIRPETQVTFRNLERIKKSKLSRIIPRYPETVRENVHDILPFLHRDSEEA